MKWWDFTDINFIILFSIILTLLFCAVILTLSFFIHGSIAKRYAKLIKEESNSVRVFDIDVKRNVVSYFNRSDLRNKQTIDLKTFYDKFHPNDAEKVKSWIFSICVNPNNAEKYLEADIIVHHGKGSYFSLLKLLKYNEKLGIIHIESHVLVYITPNNDSKKKKDAFTGVLKRSVIADMINKNKTLHGYTFAIKFFYIRQKALTNDKVERYMAMTLKNELYPFASNSKIPRQILEINDNEITIFDLRISNTESAIQLANSMAHSLGKCISVNGFSDSIDFSIGIVENRQFYQDFDKILEYSTRASIKAQQNNMKVYSFQRNDDVLFEVNKYQDEVKHLFDFDTLRYLYRPIIDVSTSSILGYFEYVKAYDSPFTSFSEMCKYAYNMGKGKDLLALVSKMVIPKFANEVSDPKTKLFFQVSLFHIPMLNEIISQIHSSSRVNLVLVFDEQEVNANSSQINEFLVSLRAIKNENNYELAMLLNDRNLLLDPSVYNAFDYFVAGANTIGEIKKNGRVRLSIHALIEKLLKYKKPIIATDLDGWAAIELIVKSGINLISSEAIAPSNDMLLPIEKKKMVKIAAMADKYQ
ncbi:MAG: hypothetical protein MJ227_02210 [Bacilli bacterium]|nr:hypothetical protein [Bacilli bacterium]